MEDWNNWGAHNKVEVNLSFPHNPIFHRSILPTFQLQSLGPCAVSLEPYAFLDYGYWIL